MTAGNTPRRRLSFEIQREIRMHHQIAADEIQEETRAVESPLRDGNSYDDGFATDTESCPFGCCERESLGDFILKRGFFEGACSDITIRAFSQDYKLHKLILDRSGYFSSLFNGPWNDPTHNVHELIFDDQNITQESFELAIAKLYGALKPKTELQHTLSMIAIGQYLDIQEIVCTATDNVIRSLDLSNIAEYSSFAVSNDYGKASERIIDSSKGLLCSDGWQNGVKAWDGVPSSIIGSVVGSDCFFVPSEWERALFAIKLIERRQQQNKYDSLDDIEDDLEPITFALNHHIYFCHLTAEQLTKLEGFFDIFGKSHIDPAILRDALWLRVALHKQVATANRKSNELGLTTSSEDPPDNINMWFIPTRDETLYGTPEQLEKSIKEHHHIRDDLPSGKTTENPGEALYKVSKIPPFRFSIAFSGVSELEPDKRVYAKTLWHAGSYWNLYIQKIKTKKGYQMGVYIHRASSSAPSKSGLLNRDVLNKLTKNDDDYNVFVEKMSNLSVNYKRGSNESFSDSTPGEEESGECEEEDGNGDEEDEEDEEGSFLNYEDNRITTSVYYVIYTPSRKVKTSLTCFISTPDLFNKSQSWGWKSNSMCSFNEDGTLSKGQDKLLKFMVILGNT